MTINFNLHAHPDRRLIHVGYNVDWDNHHYEWSHYDWDELKLSYVDTVESRGFHSGSFDHCISGYFDGESWRLADWEVLATMDLNEVWVWPADDAPSFETIEEMVEWVLSNRHEK